MDSISEEIYNSVTTFAAAFRYHAAKQAHRKE